MATTILKSSGPVYLKSRYYMAGRGDVHIRNHIRNGLSRMRPSAQWLGAVSSERLRLFGRHPVGRVRLTKPARFFPRAGLVGSQYRGSAQPSLSRRRTDRFGFFLTVQEASFRHTGAT